MAELQSLNHLVKCIQENDAKEFKSHLKELPGDVSKLSDQLNDQGKERAIKWCREAGVYFIHRLFTKVTKTDSIIFIKKNLTYYKVNHLLDAEDGTWLHVAIEFNTNNAILEFLINDINIDVELRDIYGNTALHIACQKSKYNEGELGILIKKSNQLILPSRDDVTPLELACEDQKKLTEIQNNNNVKLHELLKSIDNISKDLPQTKDYYYNDQASNEKIWSTLLHKNDKYRLFNVMKKDAMRKDAKFKDRFYLSSEEIKAILSQCHENGQEILTFVKKRFLHNNKLADLEKIFTGISGLTLKQSPNDPSVGHDPYYRSGLFVALITGRFELVPPLLMCCQFNVIPYALITCLICQKLSAMEHFSDHVVKTIEKLKEVCETVATEVLNRTAIRDPTELKNSIYEFLKKDKFMGREILDIAFIAKCSRFLGSPSCQEVFDRIWCKKGKKCSNPDPNAKFWIHSFFHVVFLCLFAYVLIGPFYSSISVVEWICYAYGVGYLFEEIWQFYTLNKSRLATYYFKNATNVIDMLALTFLILGFAFRFIFRVIIIAGSMPADLFKESHDVYLFVPRLILCFSFILFSMRIIYFGSIFQIFGPKITMISKMIVRDLLPLVFIFAIFIFAFGISFQSLLFPNSLYNVRNSSQFDKRQAVLVIGDIFRRAVFTIFDVQYTLEELDGSNKPTINEYGRISVYFLLLIYIVVVNVMLMNLLIALFSHTVTVIIQGSKESWKANRYKDVKEYLNRSMFPPPLNVFEIIFALISSYTESRSKKKSKVQKPSSDQKDLISRCDNEEKIEFSSFKILQAFALRDCRYKLVQTQEDKEYEIQMNIKKLLEKLNEFSPKHSQS